VGTVVPAPSSKVGRRAEAAAGSNGAVVEQGKERGVTIDNGVGCRARAAGRSTKQELAGHRRCTEQSGACLSSSSLLSLSNQHNGRDGHGYGNKKKERAQSRGLLG
jgi:hypothetical protein